MTRIVKVLAVLLLTVPCMAGIVMFNSQGGVAMPAVIFWFNAEENDPPVFNQDCTGPAAPVACCTAEFEGTCDEDYTLGSSECSDGTSDGTYQYYATMEATKTKVGSYSFESSGGFDRSLRFDHTVPWDICSNQAGTVAFWFNQVDAVGEGGLFRCMSDADDDAIFEIYLCNTDEICARWYRNYATEVTWQSSGANMVVDTWYFVEAHYTASVDGVTGVFTLYIDGVLEIIDASSGFQYLDDGTEQTLLIGGTGGYDHELYIDNLMVSDDAATDFDAIELRTTKPTGACDG